MTKGFMKRWWVILAFICMTISICGANTCVVSADTIMPAAVNNIQFSKQDNTELVVTDNGYMRVAYDGKKIWIEYYDNNFNIKSKKSLKMELPWWGGFYAGENAYYIVEGQGNAAESYSKEVIRVIKYDKSWKRLGAAKITGNPNLFGGEVRSPFYYGCVEFTEHNGVLYIVTGHEGYIDGAYGQGHQGYMMIAVNEDTMTGEIVNCDYWHSFAQYIDKKDKYLYLLELSEGSRCTALSKMDANKFVPGAANDETCVEAYIPVLEYGGKRNSAWAIEPYASVDGIAISDKNILCIGTSINQKKYNSVKNSTPHNIYLTVTPVSNFKKEATKVKKITNFTGGGKSFWGLKITKINDNKFMISWEVADVLNKVNKSDLLSGNVLNYIFIDGAGNVISKKYTAAAAISDCQPIVKGSNIVYTASTTNMVNFYRINTNSGKFTKKCYRVAGPNSAWNLSDGVLTFTGTGAISVDVKEDMDPRYSLSKASLQYSSRHDDTPWTCIRDRVKKIVVKPGITQISARSFAHFTSVNSITIGTGVKQIGDACFYGCHSLDKVVMPASVTKIGKKVLRDGYWYSGEYRLYATIYAPEGSQAIKYAKNNNIHYVATKIKVGKTVLSSVKSTDHNAIKVIWKKASNAKKYQVWRAASQKGKYNLIATTTATTFIDKKLITGKKYYYKVRAINGKTKGNFSSAKYAIPTLKQVNGVKLTSTESSVKVAWNKVNGAKNYQIYRAVSKNGIYKKVATTAKLDFVDLKVTSDSKYFYKIRAQKKVNGKFKYGKYSTIKYIRTKTMLVEPVGPNEPNEPSEPNEPVVPVDPVDPNVPVEPEEPVEPEAPIDPEEPVAYKKSVIADGVTFTISASKTHYEIIRTETGGHITDAINMLDPEIETVCSFSETCQASEVFISLTPDKDINYEDLKYVVNNDTVVSYPSHLIDLEGNILDYEEDIGTYYVVPDWEEPVAEVYTLYRPGMYIKHIAQIYLIDKGIVSVEIYYKGKLLHACVIKSEYQDTDELEYRALVKEIEGKVWTEEMSNHEKLVAFGKYIANTYTYEEADCKVGATFLAYAARDLGLETMFRFRYENVYDYTSAYTIGGHASTIVNVDGQLRIYDAQGGSFNTESNDFFD